MEEKVKWNDEIKYETEKCPVCHHVLKDKQVEDDKASASLLKRYCPKCGAYKTFQ